MLPDSLNINITAVLPEILLTGLAISVLIFDLEQGFFGQFGESFTKILRGDFMARALLIVSHYHFGEMV